MALELFKIERPSNIFGSTSNVITHTIRVYSDEDV